MQEGYPLESTRRLSQAEILDYGARMTEYRGRSDLRYYKGTEYANSVEALARRRVSEAFASNGISPNSLFVNVQPLSGRTCQQCGLHCPIECWRYRDGYGISSPVVT